MTFTAKQKLFSRGENNGQYYRIPSLLQTKKGRLLALCDRRLDRQEDWGRIHISLRKSDDHGETWTDEEVIIKTYEGLHESSFVMDACILEDEIHQTIHLLVDMFPHSQGFFSADALVDGNIYNKKGQLRLWSQDETYWMDQKGAIFNNDALDTSWSVDVSNDPSTWGNLYYQDKSMGNILVDNEFFKADPCAHLWHFTSKDEGDSWEFKADITFEIKEPWMYFLGIAPGVGLQLENGRLCFPVYYTNCNLGYSQSSAIIYSDDFGETWKRSTSPNDARLDTKTMKDLDSILTESQLCQYQNRLFLFMRNLSGMVQVSESHDDGTTWSKPHKISVTDPYCQMSLVSDEKFIYLSNPKGPKRNNGRLTVLDDFHPVYETVFHEGPFEYSCLALDKEQDRLHIFYEAKDDFGNMCLYYLQGDLRKIKGEVL